MEKILKISRTIRNNWKKSAVGAFVFYYGAATVKEKYEISVIMTAACKEAARYGDSQIPMDRNPTLITVILNPVANKRKAKQDYEKYCEPLLHLAGLQVDVVQTTAEGSAKEIVETLRGTEAIIVAGGDGTLSESVTGLLRRNDEANRFPLGVLPLGRTNTLGNTLFPSGKGVERVRQLIDASMAIIKGHTVWKDAMKIEPLTTENETPPKPTYAMTTIEWGAFRDTNAKKEKYWIFGPLREYAAYILNGYKDSLTWDCSGVIKLTPPCAGCQNCLKKKPEVAKRWSFFIPQTAATSELDQTSIVNSECARVHELCFKTCDFTIRTPNVDKLSPVPSLSVILGKPKYSYTEFVQEGWNRIRGNKSTDLNVIPARTVELLPNVPTETDKEYTIEIDKEDFDLKPVKITLLPKVVKLFYNPKIQNE